MPTCGKALLQSACASLAIAAGADASAQSVTQPTYESLWEQVHSAGCLATDGENSFRFDCAGEHKTYFFSKPGTPMHPGVVIRAIISADSGISIHSSGYSFDDRTRIAFESWLDGFQKQDQQIEEAIKKKKQSAARPP